MAAMLVCQNNETAMLIYMYTANPVGVELLSYTCEHFLLFHYICMTASHNCASNLPENLQLSLFQVWISTSEVLQHRVCKTHGNFFLLYFACRSETSPEDSVK